MTTTTTDTDWRHYDDRDSYQDRLATELTADEVVTNRSVESVAAMEPGRCGREELRERGRGDRQEPSASDPGR